MNNNYLTDSEIMKKDPILMDWDITPAYVANANKHIVSHKDDGTNVEMTEINKVYQIAANMLKYSKNPNIFVTEYSKEFFKQLSSSFQEFTKIPNISKDKKDTLKEISKKYKKLGNQVRTITKGIDEPQLYFSIDNLVNNYIKTKYAKIIGDSQTSPITTFMSAATYFALKEEHINLWTYNSKLPEDINILKNIFEDKDYKFTSPTIYTAGEHPMPKHEAQKYGFDPNQQHIKVLFEENKETNTEPKQKISSDEFRFSYQPQKNDTNITGIDFNETNPKKFKSQMNNAKKTYKAMSKKKF